MRFSSFNVVHLAVGVFVVVVFITLMIAIGGSHTRTPAGRMQNATQLRGIHQGLVTYSKSNAKWYPGINERGDDDKISVEQRFHLLIAENYITPDWAISPLETKPIKEWDEFGAIDVQPVTAQNYSYSMLQIPQEGGRRDEWSETLNSQAIVMSDRNTGTPSEPSSIHNDEPGDWRGSVLWNDNHVAFENEPVFETTYRGGPEAELNKNDHLFQSDGHDDALLIHSGN